MTEDVAGHRDPGPPVTDRGHSGPPGQGSPPTSQAPGLGFPADPGLVNRPTPLAWAAPHGFPSAAPVPRVPAAGEAGGPHRGLIITVVVALVGGLALGITGLLAFGGDIGTPRATPSGPQSKPAAEPPTAGRPARFSAAEIDAARPRAVTVTWLDHGTRLRLRWKLRAGNHFPLLIKEQGRPTPTTLDFGTTTTIIGNVRRGSPHCFTVGALLALSPTPQYALASPVCAH